MCLVWAEAHTGHSELYSIHTLHSVAAVTLSFLLGFYHVHGRALSRLGYYLLFSFLLNQFDFLINVKDEIATPGVEADCHRLRNLTTRANNAICYYKVALRRFYV